MPRGLLQRRPAERCSLHRRYAHRAAHGNAGSRLELQPGRSGPDRYADTQHHQRRRRAAIRRGHEPRFNGADSATGTDGNGSTLADDITNTPRDLNTFNENTWRIRGGSTAATGGTPANGWSNLVPEYTQGLQFSVPTTDYSPSRSPWTGTPPPPANSTPRSSTRSAEQPTPSPPKHLNANDTVTITAANNFKFGDEVTISGLGIPTTAPSRSSPPTVRHSPIGSRATRAP